MSSTKKLPTLKPGDPFGGGFFVSNFYTGGKPYALIVAPKADGEQSEVAWNTTNTLVKGATSYSDGLANTTAMAKAGSVIAKWSRGLAIDNYDDWYIPSRLEALLLYGEFGQLKPSAKNKIYCFEKLAYWTSTQAAGDESAAWCQVFYNGYQSYDRKDD